MENINYKQLYQRFTKGLSQKTKDIFDRRFGVKAEEPETLESIGQDLGITRERVRQIEEVGLNSIRKNNSEILENVFGELASYFDRRGGLAKEEVALSELGGKTQKPYVLFLLTLGGDRFTRVCEKKDFHYFWSTLPSAKTKVKETLDSLVQDMKTFGKPLSQKEFSASLISKHGFSENATLSYLEVSKRIMQNKEGKLGLIDWPEIKPRGVKDKAFLVFKSHQKPLHFTDVAKLIDKSEYSSIGKKTYAQTVHNELIKDPRFVLVGRGTYALSEWGYYPGTIKDIIVKVLNAKTGPMHKDEVVKEVLAQRFVAKNTVLMNLNNKKYFEKDGKDHYFLKGVQQA